MPSFPIVLRMMGLEEISALMANHIRFDQENTLKVNSGQRTMIL